MTLEIKLLVLVVIANGAPIVAGNVLRARFDAPLDIGKMFFDGQPVFGKSKTWRGMISAFLLTVSVTLLLQIPWQVGAMVAAGAMTGDLLSSFIKRRLSIPPSGMALGLDQVPESLIPLLMVRTSLSLSVLQISILVVAFIIIELLLSRALFKLHLRKQPY